MKTKKDVKKHLEKSGYRDDAIERICGFLIAKELKEVDEVFRFKKGSLRFKDFLLWFNMELPNLTVDDLEYGDYVHVCDGHDVLVLTLMEEGKDFVGFDGVEVGCYVLDKDSRMCTDEELAEVMDTMHANCLDFDYATCSIVPLRDADEN